MEGSTGKQLAQLGGIALAISLVLPWFEVSLAGLMSEGISLWDLNKVAAGIVVAVAVFQVVQPKVTTPDRMPVVVAAVGLLAAGAIAYKLWIDPPSFNDIAELKELGVDFDAMLESIGIKFGPAYGAYVGLAGALAGLVGGYMELRGGAAAPSSTEAWNSTHGDPQRAAENRYVAPQAQQQTYGQAAQAVAQPARQIAPDPFAPPAPPAPAQPASPHVPPDPFAPPQQQ